MAHRYNKWTDYEDHALEELVQLYGSKNWTQISNKLKICYQISKRSGKQCRQRWHNRLCKQLNTLEWSQDEDRFLLSLQATYGNRWIDITHHFKGRSDNQVKNHFYSIIRKSIRRMCKLVDIKTHTMNIYSIKPNTISHIFYLGGEGEEKRDGYVNQRNSLSTDASRKRDNCSKIAKTIIFYIFAGKQYNQYLSEQKKDEVICVLYKIRQMNQSYQTEMSSQNSISGSEHDSSLEKNQRREKIFSGGENYMEKMGISLNQLPKQNNIQNQQRNYGIFSHPQVKIYQGCDKVPLQIIETADMLGRIQPYSQISMQTNNQCNQEAFLPNLNKLESKLSLYSCVVPTELQNCMREEESYFLQHIMEYETPMKSADDIYKQCLL